MRVLLSILFLAISLITNAQSKKEAKVNSLLEQASMHERNMEFEAATKLCAKAVKTDPTMAKAWYSYGNVLKKQGKNQEVQKQCFVKVVELEPNSKRGLSSYINLSTIYTAQGKFDSAFYNYKLYAEHKILPERRKQSALKELAQKEFAAKNYKHALNINPIPLNDTINLPGSLQYFPILTGDEKQMLFTRRKKGGMNEDLVLANNNGVWFEALKLPGTVNSHESEGTATMSADGSFIVCSYCGINRPSEGSCDLYITRLEGNRWTELENLGKNINTKGYETQPSLSADGRTLYFVSDREGGLGELDIWKSEMDQNGNWGGAVNLGPAINTPKNEGSPFIHSNGTSLFFASKGHSGMGGYDLFLSEKEDNEWTKARNLGYPINDQNNQVSLYVTASGEHGYFSREEYASGSLTPDRSKIWMFQVPPELKLGHRSNYVKGIVYDNITKKPIGAELKLVQLETGETKSLVKSNSSNGSYLVMLAEGSEYAFYAETKGYLFKSVAFNYTEHTHYDPIELDIYLDPIIKGVTVELSNIYFQTGKSVLLNKSKVELNKLYELMKKNPTLRIELAGHTDNTGSDALNIKLSKLRVEAVKAHLVKKGIAANRMVGKGYGSSKPVADNATKEGRKKNRRVEFTVL